MFQRSAKDRNSHITDVRATNYGVVRLTLLEQIYEHMYEQKRQLGSDERMWPHRILGNSHITKAIPREDGGLTLTIQNNSHIEQGLNNSEEELEADLIIAATGYKRNAHVEMLRDAWSLLPISKPVDQSITKEGITGWKVDAGSERRITVGRDYKVQFQDGKLANGCGIWLQGCCEGTHGVSCKSPKFSQLRTKANDLV